MMRVEHEYVEHEYERRGALSYLAAWDVHCGRLFWRCETTTAIVPFGRLHQPSPYKTRGGCSGSSTTVAVIAASASCKHLQNAWPNLILVHTPVHASWLNQIEIIFSVLQRKVLPPNDFASLQAVVDRLDASRSTTTKSPGRSAGSSRAKTSPRYSSGSPATSRNSASQPKLPRTSNHDH